MRGGPGHEVVAVFGGRPVAEIARGVLETHGIPAELLVDDEGGLAPVAELTEGVRVIVRSDHATEARALLAVSNDGTADRVEHRRPASSVRLTAAVLSVAFIVMIVLNVARSI